MRKSLLFVALLLAVGCTRHIPPSMPFSKDPSLEELLSLYQREREIIPPLKGLIKVTITDNIDKGFWARWRSRNGVIAIDGYNLLGGTLFHLEVDESEISLSSSESNFKGSREAFQQFLIVNHSEIRMEWVMLLDQIARGGLPDIALWHRPALSKEDNHLILSFFGDQGNLAQKVWIERKRLRVRKRIFYNSDGLTEAAIKFDDYRPIRQMFFPFYIQIESRDKLAASMTQMEIVFKEIKAMPE